MFWKRIAGIVGTRSDAPRSDLVLVHVPLSTEGYGSDEERAALFEMQDRLEIAVQKEKAKAFEFDGDEWGDGWLCLFLYAPDGDALAQFIVRFMASETIPEGSFITVRRGRDGPEHRIEFPRRS